MKRKAKLLGFSLAAIGIAVAAYGWRAGWFSRAPSAVIKDTIAKAIAGHYEEATRNLRKRDRDELLGDRDLLQSTWEAITRQRTLRGVTIQSERVDGDKAYVKFELQFQDAKPVELREICEKEDGLWKHSLADAIRHLAPDSLVDSDKRFWDQQLKKTPAALAADYSTVPDTGIALRLPLGCEWLRDKEEYKHPQLGLYIRADTEPGYSAEERLRRVEQNWKGTPAFTWSKGIVAEGGTAFFETTVKTATQKPWRTMVRILGDGRRNVAMIAHCPDVDRLGKVVKESLLTARWDPAVDPDLRERLPFVIKPTADLHLRQVKLSVPSVLFTQSGKDKPPAAGEAVLVATARVLPLGTQDRRAEFERALSHVAPHESKLRIEKIQPIAIGSLQGFESISTVDNDRDKNPTFRYVVALFKTSLDVFWLEGTVGQDQRDRFEPQFREMARTFMLK